eukprot:10098260-Karenia_brevis.AAC.1
MPPIGRRTRLDIAVPLWWQTQTCRSSSPKRAEIDSTCDEAAFFVSCPAVHASLVVNDVDVQCVCVIDECAKPDGFPHVAIGWVFNAPWYAQGIEFCRSLGCELVETVG